LWQKENQNQLEEWALLLIQIVDKDNLQEEQEGNNKCEERTEVVVAAGQEAVMLMLKILTIR